MLRSLVQTQRQNAPKILLNAFQYSLDFHLPPRYSLPIASLLFSKKMHNSLGRNLAFQAVLKLLLMSLRRGGMIPEFAILHAVLGAFL